MDLAGAAVYCTHMRDINHFKARTVEDWQNIIDWAIK